MNALAESLQGDLLLPGAREFEVARAVWNGLIDRHPALIVYCTCTEDVIAAITFAREGAVYLSCS